jgi:manganese transport protein
VFAVAAVKLHPAWGAVGHGFVPHVPTQSPLLYAYFAVGLLGAAMTRYEVYFYSSGAVEERWGPKDLGLNKANAMIGYGLSLFVSRPNGRDRVEPEVRRVPRPPSIAR